MKIFRQNKPVFIFLLKFLGIYFLGNIVYGLWVESYQLADPATYFVSVQSSWILQLLYPNINYAYNPDIPHVWMSLGNRTVINIFEGCNGLNVMILYIAFIVAYRGSLKYTVYFMAGGILFIHLANLFRIALLFVVAEEIPRYMYFTHKFLFTGIIYAAVFLLWFLWVKYFSFKRDEQDGNIVESRQ